MTATTDKLRKERGSTHGDFAEGAVIVQGIMDLLMGGVSWKKMNPVQKEVTHMIAHKLQRIVTGDPDVDDHWDDIAGYAHLVIIKKIQMQEYMNVRRTGSPQQVSSLPEGDGHDRPSGQKTGRDGNAAGNDRSRKAANRGDRVGE